MTTYSILGCLVALCLAATRWKLAHDTGVHRYYEHADGRRRVIKVGRGHQPVNRRWLDGGTWRRPPALFGAGSPHRTPDSMPAPRFSVIVDSELLEADSFGGIIRMMRERGHSDDDVLAAALVIHREPRGAQLRILDAREAADAIFAATQASSIKGVVAARLLAEGTMLGVRASEYEEALAERVAAERECHAPARGTASRDHALHPH